MRNAESRHSASASAAHPALIHDKHDTGALAGYHAVMVDMQLYQARPVRYIRRAI